ncbi:MgtC/SapB family protein [Sphingosinicella rhizophila]|uniref:DUF4010 domain-containing protein n=1 Tax=Sphingosinicella rhizophila TaxID=3050082 RepID=A0ABU3Q533_9SPHN|nr:DUF4010 domain-containing protein [Sphingosinicella sp. GR2756]MDT9598516.1 DUF4010 domain-containing protein [Sphingosinicella sp. GR2756]
MLSSPADFLPGLALALAIGMLLGVERGWSMRGEKPGGRVAGIRTFGLIGLLGGLIGIGLAGPSQILSLLLGGGAIAALLLGYRGDMLRDDNVSATSTIAAILTLGLGASATTGHMALASVGTGAAVILLASRRGLHQALQLTSEADIKALLRLILVVFVILPLLPNVGMGPFDALNPQRLWMVVVVTGAISFVGYGLARWLGTGRGALVTAVVGALVSSTAVTLDSARHIRDGGANAAAEAAVAIASLEMLFRALLLVALLAPFALSPISALIGPGIAVAAAATAVLLYRCRGARLEAGTKPPKAPGLGLALLFAATVATISLASAWAEASFGQGGGALVIALGGTADIDAAIAAVGALPPDALPVRSIALAIAAPILFNTLFKLGLLLAVARSRAPWASATLGATSAALLLPILIKLS